MFRIFLPKVLRVFSYFQNINNTSSFTHANGGKMCDCSRLLFHCPCILRNIYERVVSAALFFLLFRIQCPMNVIYSFPMTLAITYIILCQNSLSLSILQALYSSLLHYSLFGAFSISVYIYIFLLLFLTNDNGIYIYIFFLFQVLLLFL